MEKVGVGRDWDQQDTGQSFAVRTCLWELQV